MDVVLTLSILMEMLSALLAFFRNTSIIGIPLRMASDVHLWCFFDFSLIQLVILYPIGPLATVD